jgi:phosphatidylserine decarboxylase
MAKEGIVFVAVSFLIALIVLLIKIPILSYVLAILFYILTAYFAFFFRDPPRKITAAPHEIVSPADGRVLDISEKKGQVRIVIFLSIFDVHITRLPYAGSLIDMDYVKGEFLPAYREKASELNERITLDIDSSPFKYRLKLIAGIAARRIRMWVKKGQNLKTGDKIGIMMFGSRAELFIPGSVQLMIKKGEKVYGGKTLIGKIQNQE